jgi:hypothetical protein
MKQKFIYTGKMKDLPDLNFERTTINLSDYFNEPSNLTNEEIYFANRYTRDKYINFDEDYFIELVMRPYDLKNFVVNIIREYEIHKKKKSR